MHVDHLRNNSAQGTCCTGCWLFTRPSSGNDPTMLHCRCVVATAATGSPAAGAAPAASTSTAPDTEVTATSRVDPSATTPATQPTPAQPPAAPAPANGASAKSMSVMASVGALMIASLLL